MASPDTEDQQMKTKTGFFFPRALVSNGCSSSVNLAIFSDVFPSYESGLVVFLSASIASRFYRSIFSSLLLEVANIAQCLKITQNVAFEFLDKNLTF